MIDNQINIEEKGKLSEIANRSANSLGPADVVRSAWQLVIMRCSAAHFKRDGVRVIRFRSAN